MHRWRASCAWVEEGLMAAGVEVVETRGGLGRGEAAAIGMLAFTVLAWGCTGRVTAEATPYAEPLTLTMLRAAPTAVVLLVALPLLRYRLPATRADWGWTAVSGLLMVTWFLWAFTESVSRVGPGIAIVLMSTSPFFIALAERLVFGRRITPLMLLGMVVGFAGMILVVSGQMDANGDTADIVIGMALAVSAAIAWAAGTLIVSEQLTRRPATDLIGLTAGQYVVGGAVLLAIVLLADGTGGAEWSESGLWVPVAFISVIGSAVATVTYFGSLRWLDPASVTSWLFLSPVVAVLLELVLGNAPDAVVLGGMVVTIVGVAIVSAAPRIAASKG
jgi:probable blue pigment (indigoidine) exporter